jgi:hypothetical protein
MVDDLYWVFTRKSVASQFLYSSKQALNWSLLKVSSTFGAAALPRLIQAGLLQTDLKP